MKDRKTFICSAFKYVVPADYEKWFEDLAAEGWRPEKVGQWNSLVMHFKKSEPKKYRYVVDMQPFPKKDYKQTYMDFGWEFVGQMASAYVWRREYEGERPESFSDTESRKDRNRRFVGAASVSFIIFLLGGFGFAAGLKFGLNDVIDQLQFGIASVLCFAAAVALGLVMKKIRKNINS
jgi:hypothetical protein